MSYLFFSLVLLAFVPTVLTAYKEFQNKNFFGAIGMIIYLSLIGALAVYQIFIR